MHSVRLLVGFSKRLSPSNGTLVDALLLQIQVST